jgi:hypothetical protein
MVNKISFNAAVAGLVCVVSTLSVGAGDVLSVQGQLPLPLPAVLRTRTVDGEIIDRPSLIVAARVTARTEIEEDSDRPGGLTLDPKRPSWTLVRGQVFDVIRLNERSESEPDLRTGYFSVEQIDRGERPLRFELGGLYVLFLNPSPRLLKNWNPKSDSVDHLPPYALAVPQGGFRLVDGKLRVLQRGGPLDRYDGRMFEDVVKIWRNALR